MNEPPLIAHIVFRFDTGGLENGLVNLVNHLPSDEFRHVIIALTEATQFRARLQRTDVSVLALGKRPGKDPKAYFRLYRLLRRLRPAIVHTRNIGTLDCQLIAALARVPVRIHGEHGWDVHDPDGVNPRYRRLRRLLIPLVNEVIAVSRDLERWLVQVAGVPQRKVRHICNGVDTERFRPTKMAHDTSDLTVVVGSVLRFEAIKDPLNLVRAFLLARRELARRDTAIDLRLLMIGDGPLRAEALATIEQAGEAQAVELPGSRNDVALELRRMHIYALGSRREGISNTVLEAMASGLPIVATATGGNLELVRAGETGTLVPPENAQELANALVLYALNAPIRAAHARAARMRAVSEYSLATMVAAYGQLYRDSVLRAGWVG